MQPLIQHNAMTSVWAEEGPSHHNPIVPIFAANIDAQYPQYTR